MSSQSDTIGQGTQIKSLHYKRDRITTFPVPVQDVFKYMSRGNHRHAAFKSHTLVGIAGNEVTVEAEIFNQDGSTVVTNITHRLNPPKGIETTMSGGVFSGAKFTHSYTDVDGKTTVDLEGTFPAFPGVTEPDELKMIDDFFATVFAEDTETLKSLSTQHAQ